MDCRLPLQTVQTTSDPTSFLKNSYRLRSQMFLKEKKHRCMAMDSTSVIGSMLRIIVERLKLYSKKGKLERHTVWEGLQRILIISPLSKKFWKNWVKMRKVWNL